MSDEAKCNNLSGVRGRRAVDRHGTPGERDRVLVCETIADLIETISPRLKTRTGRRPYILIVRDHHQLRFELREP
jgi:hypothetical protein